jgi:NNP family nitrate/nitrite transporter-like MFS transporter
VTDGPSLLYPKFIANENARPLASQLVTAQGVMLTWIGLVNPTNAVALVGGIQAMAIFMDAANGAAYSLVPHVNPQYNGIMSGYVESACRIFALAARY